MKVIITGANGFVGAALCRYFHQQGHQITALGRQEKPPANLLLFAAYIQADITNPIPYFDADVCIHAAGLASDIASYDNLFLNNVNGTANVLEAAKQCRYFIFISSSSVYDFKAGAATENDADLNNPITGYGKTKLLAEELVISNIPVQQQRLILRPRAIYGIGDRVLLPRLLKLLKWNTIFCPVSNGVQTSATHIKNLAYAVELFLNQKNKPVLQVFNIADDQVYQLREIILKSVSAVEKRDLRLVEIPFSALKILSFLNSSLTVAKQISPVALKAITENSVLCLENIKQKLGYRPLYNFHHSCDEISEWIHNMGGREEYLARIEQAPWLVSKCNN